MAVRWESLRVGVVLALVVAAFGWATLWLVARSVGAQGATPQGDGRTFTRESPSPLDGVSAGQVWVSPAGLRLLWIPPGAYEMGSNNGGNHEQPVHLVRLTWGFWLGETEVTQAQWKAVMGNSPSDFRDCSECPVENVSWEDCQIFVRKLNEKYPVVGGMVWRLPYESEWEYACRAGTQREYYGGDGEASLGALGWYEENSGGRMHPVRQKQPNGWGLYDMHGNVWEWCEDWCDEDYYRISPVEEPRGAVSGEHRVLRSGSWKLNAGSCRAASRSNAAPANRNDDIGLRVAVGAP